MDPVETIDPVEQIARACLYEGYLLWPYRRSALKNAKRWTFGGVYPRSCATALGEPSVTQTQVLLETGRGTTVRVRVRFLHIVDRRVLRDGPDGPEPVDELTIDGERYLSWQEATEREVVLPPWTPGHDGHPHLTTIDIPAGEEHEPLADRSGRRAGTLVRSWHRLTGTVETDAAEVDDRTLRLTVRTENTTPCPAPADGARRAREEMSVHAFVSTHTVLRADDGFFASLVDPPDALRDAAASCRNIGTWPVLVGDGNNTPDGNGPVTPGETAQETAHRARTVLSAPIILGDFPAIAPESPGDLFDGGEIDQLLILSVLSLTDEEQREARACDPRAREILDRCAALGPDELMGLHGTIRAFRPLEDA